MDKEVQMALKLCSKEKEFSFGENSKFLRTKMKSPSDKISSLSEDVGLSHYGDDGRSSPSFVNSLLLALLKTRCSKIHIPLQYNWIFTAVKMEMGGWGRGKPFGNEEGSPRGFLGSG